MTGVPIGPSGLLWLRRVRAANRDPRAIDHVAFCVESASDEAGMRRALGRLQRRHQALRTVYDLEQQEQSLRDPYELDDEPEVAIHDACAEEEPCPSLLNVLGSMIDVEAGRPFAAALIRRGRASTLCVLLHHLAADARSISLLLQEIGASLRARAGETPEARNPLGYYDWSKHLHTCVTTGHFDEAAGFWRDQVGRSHAAQRDWPQPTGAPPNKRTSMVFVEPDGLRSLLRGKAARTRAGVPLLVLAAYADALATWLDGSAEVPVRMIGHGRQPIAGLNPRRVVGWCSGGYPLVLPGPATSPAGHVELVRAAFAGVPHGGTSYVALAAYADADAAFAKPPTGLRMNYVGRVSSSVKRVDAIPRRSDHVVTPSGNHAAIPQPSDLLDMEVGIVDGGLYIVVSTDANVVSDADADTIERHATTYLRALSD